MHYYVNATSPDQIHEVEQRSARLDALPQWSAYASREEAQEATRGEGGRYTVEGGVLSRAGMIAAPTIAPRRDDEIAAPAAGHKAPPKGESDGDEKSGAHATPSPSRRSTS